LLAPGKQDDEEWVCGISAGKAVEIADEMLTPASQAVRLAFFARFPGVESVYSVV
jgi:hypothetical protein